MQYKKQILCCLAFLTAGIGAVWLLLSQLTLHQKLALGLVKPDVISVSMPLPENMTDAGTTFERLTSGFEKQYPSFGIALKLYADSSEIPEDSDMYLDYQNPEFQSADISEIYRELDMQEYITDFSGSASAVPLSFSVPVIYYDMADMNLFQQLAGKDSIELTNLPETTFRGAVSEEYFQKFLENPECPVFDTSFRMYQAEQNPASSGRIHLLPVTENGSYQKVFHNLCKISSQSEKNKQYIAMLWIEYLLSEEAQTILFAEHYGDLPLHESAFDTAVHQHQEYRILEDVKSEPITEETSDE
ncbi:MAG: hypothetical protein IJ644_02785 [Oscillospiraceae bacterium]|nr:hypothetical protein [Oscillospiraceae bacterium]